MPLKPRKQIFQIKNRYIVENPNWQYRRSGGTPAVGFLQIVVKDLNLGLPRNKSRQWQGRGLKSGISGLQHQRPKQLGHAASSYYSTAEKANN